MFVKHICKSSFFCSAQGENILLQVQTIVQAKHEVTDFKFLGAAIYKQYFFFVGTTLRWRGSSTGEDADFLPGTESPGDSTFNQLIDLSLA